MPTRFYFWIVTHDKDTHKPYLIFGGDGESESRQKAFDMLGGLDFEIKRYPTRDEGTASAFFRGKRLERGDGLKKSSERIGHDKSISRMRRKLKNSSARTNPFAE
jgi:hypothetical protein